MEIQKNAPKPKNYNEKYPFSSMQKNDSFEIDEQTEEGKIRVRVAAQKWRTTNKSKRSFSVRMCEDNKIRCTRIK